MALKRGAKVVTEKDLNDVYISNSFLETLQKDNKVNWQDPSKLLASIREKGGGGALSKTEGKFIIDLKKDLKPSVNLKKFTPLSDLVKSKKVTAIVLIGVMKQFLSSEKSEKSNEEDLTVCKKGDWEIKLFQMKNKVAITILDYPNYLSVKSWSSSLEKLFTESDELFEINAKLKDKIMKLAETYGGIKMFFGASFHENIDEIGVYVGKKCKDSKKAKEELKDLQGDNGKYKVHFMKGKCTDVKKKIIEFFKNQKIKIDENDIQEGEVSK